MALSLAFALIAAPGAFPPARSTVPFEAVGDVGCHWTMHAQGERWIRGGIGQGDEDPILELVDPAFAGHGDAVDVPLEVSVGDASRRLPAKGWSSQPQDGGPPGSMAFYMDAPLRAMIGGATSVQIWFGGEPAYHATLAGTPSTAELNACVRPPSADRGDEE